MGTDDALIEEVRGAGERAGERVWPLPLWDEYRDLMKSDIADVKNAGGRPAGSISAGWFLREFVDGFPWAHLDIAGTAYTDREDATRVKGPTGIGVRLFSEFVLGRQGAGVPLTEAEGHAARRTGITLSAAKRPIGAFAALRVTSFVLLCWRCSLGRRPLRCPRTRSPPTRSRRDTAR